MRRSAHQNKNDFLAVLKPLLLVLFLGLALRIIGLGNNSYWADEIFSVNLAVKSSDLAGVILGVLKGDSCPPLYNLWLFLHVRIFGHTEEAVRALSVAFGFLTIPFFTCWPPNYSTRVAA